MTITKEGTLASFYTVNKAPIKHLRVYFSPKQVGEGDPSPENVREISGWNELDLYHTGKNLIDTINNISYGTLQNTTGVLVNNQKYNTTDYIFIPPNSYTISVKNTSLDENPVRLRLEQYSLDKNFTNNRINTTRESGSFYTRNFVPNISSYMRLSYHLTDTNIQIECGLVNSEDIKYEPYRGQILPINFPVVGKNLVDDSLRYYSANSFTLGTTVSSGYPIYLEAGTYRITIFGYDKGYASIREQGGSWIDIFENNTTGTFTIENNNYCRIAILTDTVAEISNITHVMITKGTDEQNTYEPFDNTVYGGYVDLITGELIEEQSYLLINENTPISGFSIIDNLAIITYDFLSITNKLPPIPQNQVAFVVSNYCTSKANSSIWDAFILVKNNQLKLRIVADASIITTEEDAYLYFSEHPLQIVYYPATPVVHQLTPTQLQTLIGQNNIWSNADRVEVEYDLAESNDELYRRRNILLRSAPHIETASGNIATFNTDMIAPIKSAKIYFNPVQEGTGDPAPDNIRSITGRINITIDHCGKNWFNDTLKQMNETTVQSSGKLTFLKTGKMYKFSANGADKVKIWIYNLDGTTSGGFGYYTLPMTINFTKANDFTIGLTFQKENSNDPLSVNEVTSVQIEEVESVDQQTTIYEPYNGQTIPLDWSSTAGTLCGGYVDLITGEVVQTHKKILLNDSTKWTTLNSGGWTYYYYQVQYTDRIGNKHQIISNIAQTMDDITDISEYDTTWHIQWNKNAGYYPIFGFQDTEIPPINYEDFKTLSSNNGIEICYPLEAPITVTTLTPTQLNSLRGTNNIWSNANGPIEIQYYTH